MAIKSRRNLCEYDLDDIRRCLKLSPEERLNRLEQLNIFAQAITPLKAKKIWEKLKSTGKV